MDCHIKKVKSFGEYYYKSMDLKNVRPTAALVVRDMVMYTSLTAPSPAHLHRWELGCRQQKARYS